MERDVIFKKLCAAWIAASVDLEFKITSPFVMLAGGNEVFCVAHIPEFGGPKGMLLDIFDADEDLETNFSGEKRFFDYAKSNGLYCSRINPVTYSNYHRDTFVEALSDWGYFGPTAKRPKWLVSHLN